MKKIVLVYGVISGAIVMAWLLIALAIGMADMENGMFYGFTAMIIAFSFIFVAVSSYRKQNEGKITFVKAFKIGLWITLIASTFYVVTWLISYYFFIPNFMEHYAASELEKMRIDGASAAEISKTTKEMAQYVEWYKNPLFIILLTYMEILPMGLVVSLISALLLKCKNPTAAL